MQSVRLAAFSLLPPAILRVFDRDLVVLPGVCVHPYSPLLGLWPHLLVIICALVSLTMCLRTRPCPADVSRAVELLERLQRSGELPPQKLQALQRVLQSRFCSAIREVSASRRRSTSQQPLSSSWSPRARGLRLPAVPGAARLGVPARQLRGSLGVVVSSGPEFSGQDASLGGRVSAPGLLC